MTPNFIGPVIKFPMRIHDFPGFYESYLSGALDSEEEQEIEYEIDERQNEQGIPSELRIDADFYGDLVRQHADYGQMYQDMAEAWADALNIWLADLLGQPANIHFHSLWSPREYNFGTDELTVWVPESTIRNMMVRSMADGHTMLAAVLHERLTPRSGFIPNYSNDLTAWLKPMLDYDEIELGILFDAATRIGRTKSDGPVDHEITDTCLEGCEPYSIFSNNVDWPEIEKAVEAKRAELAEAHKAQVDPDYVPPARRCQRTIDIFTEWRTAA